MDFTLVFFGKELQKDEVCLATGGQVHNLPSCLRNGFNQFTLGFSHLSWPLSQLYSSNSSNNQFLLPHCPFFPSQEPSRLYSNIHKAMALISPTIFNWNWDLRSVHFCHSTCFSGALLAEWLSLLLSHTNFSQKSVICFSNGEGCFVCVQMIGALKQLCYLDVSKNNLEMVEEQISGCENLQDLLLSNNGLTQLPGSIGKTHTLKCRD